MRLSLLPASSALCAPNSGEQTFSLERSLAIQDAAKLLAIKSKGFNKKKSLSWALALRASSCYIAAGVQMRCPMNFGGWNSKNLKNVFVLNSMNSILWNPQSEESFIPQFWRVSFGHALSGVFRKRVNKPFDLIPLGEMNSQMEIPCLIWLIILS